MQLSCPTVVTEALPPRALERRSFAGHARASLQSKSFYGRHAMVDAKLKAQSPEAVGLDSAKVEELFARVAKEVDEGLLPACQVAIARKGRVGAFATFGAANDRSLFNVFSCTKAITSAAGWLVIQEGKLDVTER